MRQQGSGSSEKFCKNKGFWMCVRRVGYLSWRLYPSHGCCQQVTEPDFASLRRLVPCCPPRAKSDGELVSLQVGGISDSGNG